MIRRFGLGYCLLAFAFLPFIPTAALGQHNDAKYEPYINGTDGFTMLRPLEWALMADDDLNPAPYNPVKNNASVPSVCGFKKGKNLIDGLIITIFVEDNSLNTQIDQHLSTINKAEQRRLIGKPEIVVLSNGSKAVYWRVLNALQLDMNNPTILIRYSFYKGSKIYTINIVGSRSNLKRDNSVIDKAVNSFAFIGE